MLKYGADVNSRTLRGSTPLHTCFYFGNIGPLKRLLEFVPEPDSKFNFKIDTKASFKDEQGRLFTPLECVVGRDRYMMWEFISNEEEYLIKLGHHELTFSEENFDKLFEKALMFKAFKCLLVLMKHYQNRKQKTTLDLVKMLGLAMTVYDAPQPILCKIYELMIA